MNSKPERIEIIDSLRGFAVFGILVSHCCNLFFLGEATNTTAIDKGVSIFVKLFINDKFYSLFSFLFGLSFSLMLSRTDDSAPRFYIKFAWRLVLLGMIGLLHNLHWNDDILSIYAFLGFILLLVSQFNNKIVFALSMLLLLNLPSVFINMIQNSMTAQEIKLNQELEEKVLSAFTEVMKHGAYLDTIKANISTHKYKLQYYMDSGRFSFMLGFFFLGLIAGRLKLFYYFKENRKKFEKTTVYAGSIALALTSLALLFVLYKDQLSSQIYAYQKPLLKLQSIVLTLTYATGMSLFFAREPIKWLAKQFAIIGKMALTNYVLHSVLGTLLLCGYGLGLINHSISVRIALVASIPIFLAMILFSHFWLSRFSYGPLEWVWRVLTYLKIIPIKKQ